MQYLRTRRFNAHRPHYRTEAVQVGMGHEGRGGAIPLPLPPPPLPSPRHPRRKRFNVMMTHDAIMEHYEAVQKKTVRFMTEHRPTIIMTISIVVTAIEVANHFKGRNARAGSIGNGIRIRYDLAGMEDPDHPSK